ncbi:tRNA-uridine aminocarboxypropyltransferase [Shewanella sp. HL-SH2]|jgi:DTW domain-containing protein YfiP|uniref:tRNA-uridine aminocarboxypropyltransferase n=1 Tax=Shewanella sp. HL-SH2 TaxID=3436238 RepID=UPI003EC0A542
MNIILLTHQRELDRKTNTGKLVSEVMLGQVKVIVWDRVNPNPYLLDKLATKQVGLLFPKQEHSALNDIQAPQQRFIDIDNDNAHRLAEFSHVIIIDSTWQEARKIYNRSDYLHQLTKITLVNELPSIFSLRRNQIEGGLCTAECACLLLSYCGLSTEADVLREKLINFNPKPGSV